MSRSILPDRRDSAVARRIDPGGRYRAMLRSENCCIVKSGSVKAIAATHDAQGSSGPKQRRLKRVIRAPSLRLSRHTDRR